MFSRPKKCQFYNLFSNEVTYLKNSSSDLANGRKANKLQTLNKQHVMGCYTGCSEFSLACKHGSEHADFINSEQFIAQLLDF